MSLHFILDGYNIINRTASLMTGNLEDRRENLIQLIETGRPQGSPENKVTVVFDGQPDMGGYQTVSSVNVIFTSGESADERIKQIVDGSRHKKSIVAVTDDKEIRYYVRALGAEILGVSEFLNGTKPHQHKKGRTKDNDVVRKSKKEISESSEQQINTEFEEIWLGKKH